MNSSQAETMELFIRSTINSIPPSECISDAGGTNQADKMPRAVLRQPLCSNFDAVYGETMVRHETIGKRPPYSVREITFPYQAGAAIGTASREVGANDELGQYAECPNINCGRREKATWKTAQPYGAAPPLIKPQPPFNCGQNSLATAGPKSNGFTGWTPSYLSARGEDLPSSPLKFTADSAAFSTTALLDVRSKKTSKISGGAKWCSCARTLWALTAA
jgi:hypothetical protein